MSKHFPTDNLRSPAALARFLLTMVLGLTLDLVSKAVAFAKLGGPVHFGADGRASVISGDPYRFIPGFLHFYVTVNQGAVFGLGQGQRWLFVAISIAAIGFLSYLFITSEKQRFYQVILGMLLAGVLGNMYDRIRYGYVRDMIHGLPGWTWPGSSREVFPWIFNVADVLLCVGVALIMIYSLFFVRAPKKQQAANAPASA
jgi:signal peptidase II